MKNRFIEGITIVAISALVDLGLLSVVFDLAFRGDYPNLQVVSFLMVFLAPILIIGLFLTGSAKASACVGMLLICIVCVYFIQQYGFRLLTELDLIVYIVGFIATMLLGILVLGRGHLRPSK